MEEGGGTREKKKDDIKDRINGREKKKKLFPCNLPVSLHLIHSKRKKNSSLTHPEMFIYANLMDVPWPY